MPETLPNSGTFTSVGKVDLKGSREELTLFAWGDFAEGRLLVEAVVPDGDGEEVFGLSDRDGFIEEEPGDGLTDEPEPIEELSLTRKGYIKFTFRAPTIRLSMIECTADPSVKYWIG